MAKAGESATPPPDPHRAATLDDVLGNEPIRDFLRNAWRDNRLPQAILLSGPTGTGKTTLAWALAREIAANGNDPATDPKSAKVQRGVHPDMFEVSGKKSPSSMILVGDIRDLGDRAATSPLEAPRKVFVINPAERMNEEASNALLKILEEPHPRLIFILVTSDPHCLLDTIRSRCAELRLEPVPTEPLAGWLASRAEIEPSHARLLAALSEGRPGVALQLAQGNALQARQDLMDTLLLLRSYGFAAVFRVAEQLLNTGESLADGIAVAVTLLRDALVLRTAGSGVLNTDLQHGLQQLAAAFSAEGLLEAALHFEKATAAVPYLYSLPSRSHYAECLAMEVGRLLMIPGD